MLVGFGELLDGQRKAGVATGAFTCYNGETILGVLQEAEKLSKPVILLISEASIRAGNGIGLIAMARGAAAHASCPACVQLDHTADLSLALSAAEAGASAVMADGSKLPTEKNLALVRTIAAQIARYGVEVEAELGHVEGNEDVATVISAGSLTDPSEAAVFSQLSGAACLAVSVGNVHGFYSGTPRLDWQRLERIRQLVDVPLSLHGASGLADEDLRRAVESGIAKVNVNTEVRQRVVAELEAKLPSTLPGLRLLELSSAVIDAVSEIVTTKLAQLDGTGRAHPSAHATESD
jgi:tagatose 1,6-diphosphate aldolase GatY/KbaY